MHDARPDASASELLVREHLNLTARADFAAAEKT